MRQARKERSGPTTIVGDNATQSRVRALFMRPG
jgi:hypothetical protein